MGSITSVRAIHFCKTLCNCEFHVARTIDYIPPPSSLYPISTSWRSRESHNIVHGCFSTWAWTMQVQSYVPHCTCLSANLMWCVCVPVHLCIAYHIQCLHHQFQPLSAALLAIALCKSDIWLQSGKIGEYLTKHIQGAGQCWAVFGSSLICYNSGK